MYPRPFEVEGSVIIRRQDCEPALHARLVRLSDPVTSPVGRMVRNRQFGIRRNEKWQLLATGFVRILDLSLKLEPEVCFLLVSSLGAWQLRRSEPLSGVFNCIELGKDEMEAGSH